MTGRIPKALRAQVHVPRGLWASLWFVFAFWTGGSLPIWNDWSVDGHQMGSLWMSVANMPRMDLPRFWHLYSGDVGRFVLLLVISGGPLVHTIFARRPKRPDAAGDYADGPRGAVADGRAEAL
jgi:hypothetical protein